LHKAGGLALSKEDKNKRKKVLFDVEKDEKKQGLPNVQASEPYESCEPGCEPCEPRFKHEKIIK